MSRGTTVPLSSTEKLFAVAWDKQCKQLIPKIQISAYTWRCQPAHLLTVHINPPPPHFVSLALTCNCLEPEGHLICLVPLDDGSDHFVVLLDECNHCVLVDGPEVR